MSEPRHNGPDPRELEKLLGGYATGTLTGAEREALFSAALSHQTLFDALADEEALREMLDDPEARRTLMASLARQKPKPAWWEWLWRPRTLVVAGSAACALLVALALRETRPKLAPGGVPPAVIADRERVQERAPVPAQPGEKKPEVQPPAGTLTRAKSDLAVSPAETGRLNAPPPPAQEFRAAVRLPSPAALPAAAEPQKMKIAVVPSSAEPAAASQVVVGEVAKNLQSTDRYSVIDQKEVDRALQDKKLADRLVDASTAASIGRQVGADAVIVTGVTPADRDEAPQAGNARRARVAAATGGVAPAREEEKLRKDATKSESSQPATLTAEAIDSRTAANVGSAQTPLPAGPANQQALGTSANLLAQQIGNQLSQRAQGNLKGARIAGSVTAIQAAVLTINLGSAAGLKVGDRLDVRRGERLLGELVITRVDASSAQGRYQGGLPAQTGDTVLPKVR